VTDNAAGNPSSSTPDAAIPTSTIQPDCASTIRTPEKAPTTAAPVRAFASRARRTPATREISTTVTSSSTLAGTATRAGSGPSRAPYETRLRKVSSVTTGVTPTKAAPSRPTASRRRGSGSRAKWSARSTGDPDHSGPTVHPSSQVR
jgi:hypothetical protein